MRSDSDGSVDPPGLHAYNPASPVPWPAKIWLLANVRHARMEGTLHRCVEPHFGAECLSSLQKLSMCSSRPLGGKTQWILVLWECTC